MLVQASAKKIFTKIENFIRIVKFTTIFPPEKNKQKTIDSFLIIPQCLFEINIDFFLGSCFYDIQMLYSKSKELSTSTYTMEFFKSGSIFCLTFIFLLLLFKICFKEKRTFFLTVNQPYRVFRKNKKSLICMHTRYGKNNNNNDKKKAQPPLSTLCK